MDGTKGGWMENEGGSVGGKRVGGKKRQDSLKLIIKALQEKSRNPEKLEN